jgi:hypothetical protein
MSAAAHGDALVAQVPPEHSATPSQNCRSWQCEVFKHAAQSTTTPSSVVQYGSSIGQAGAPSTHVPSTQVSTPLHGSASAQSPSAVHAPHVSVASLQFAPAGQSGAPATQTPAPQVSAPSHARALSQSSSIAHS